jgi:leucyl-tRNA synthetase
MRLYEMFLGPLEDSKPWNTDGITGVAKFLRKFWNLYHQTKTGEFFLCNSDAPKDHLKVLHKTIKKISEDVEKLSFNTCVSAFMECANELTALKCYKESVLKDLLILIAPFAPHIAEELWQKGNYEGSVINQRFPKLDESYLVEDSFEYPIAINGKVRHKMSFPADLPKADIEQQALASEEVQKWLDGKTPKKVIVVPKRMVNLVV